MFTRHHSFSSIDPLILLLKNLKSYTWSSSAVSEDKRTPETGKHWLYHIIHFSTALPCFNFLFYFLRFSVIIIIIIVRTETLLATHRLFPCSLGQKRGVFLIFLFKTVTLKTQNVPHLLQTGND